MKVAIVTDSNSGITIKEAKDFNIFLVAMPFIIEGKEYFEEISLSQEKFYEILKSDVKISTSQPSLLQIKELYDQIFQEGYDQIVHIPMSSGLSNSYASISAFAQEEYGEKVQVVDNQRISITQKNSVFEAVRLSNMGKNAIEIKKYLLDSKFISSIYIMVDTFTYLKKGGRVTPAAALLGGLINIKPVLQIRGLKLDAFAKTLSIKMAKSKMIKAIKHDLENDFKEYYEKNEMVLSIAHTENEEAALQFKQEIQEALPHIRILFMDPLSLSVSCHIGPGSLAVGCMINKFE